ncbi:hypothetical protein AB0K43_21250 [Kitasatospora sp. NPDC049258]|uniref:hypothetical protein n=1 Tax=Kitasatospora sp. NPDC049258 TaxID=3155394 RepID=UPI003418783B
MTNKPENEETATERLLRGALSARAAQVTAQSLRPLAPPNTRIRRLRPVLTVAVPLFGLAAGVLGYFTIDTHPTAMRQDPAPAASITASPAPSGSPSPSASSSATASESAGAGEQAQGPIPQTFRKVNFELPAGWVADPPVGPDQCLRPADTHPRSPFTCEPYGIKLTVYAAADELIGAAFPAAADVQSSDGWQRQPGACYAPDAPKIENGADGAPKQQALQSYSLKVAKLAGHQSRQATWKLTCASGEPFTVRRWDFVTQEVYVSAHGLAPAREDDLQSILDSLDLSGVHHSLATTVEPGASVSTAQLGSDCKESPAPGQDPVLKVAQRVLEAAQARDYAKLTELYRARGNVSDKDLTAQQALWHQPGVLDQLARVLSTTHLSATDGAVWPGFTFGPATCPGMKADLALFDVARPEDYRGVVTTVAADFPDPGQASVIAWAGIQLR